MENSEQFEQEKNLPSSPSPKRKYILIAAIIAVIFVAGILVLLMQKEDSPQTPEAVNPDIIMQDGTADWQTYRNDEFGFEVKYPEDWEFNENTRSKVVQFKHPAAFPHLSIMALDATAEEATYCEVRDDKERCEAMEFNVDMRVLIDWRFTDTTAHAFVGRGQQLKEYSFTFVTSDSTELDKSERDLFFNFLSTFRFIEPIEKS